MSGYRIKNWKRFQHFKDRRPPWIKLYRDLLDDMEWHELDPLAGKHLVMFWLIASENGGLIPDVKELAFRLRCTEKQVESTISKVGHWLEQSDIALISPGYQSDLQETETETETEGETISPFSPENMVNLWNTAIDFFSQNGDKPKTPKVRGLTKDRRRSCLDRIKDCQLDEEKWKTILNAIHSDDWLSGRKPSTKYPNWKATFDYVIAKSSTIMRLLEGYQREAV